MGDWAVFLASMAIAAAAITALLAAAGMLG